MTNGDFTKIQRLCDELGDEFIAMYRKELEEGNVNASHELTDSLERVVTFGNGTFTVSVKIAPQWKYVEYGRKAGGKFPPLTAIRRWVEVKPVIPYAVGTAKAPTVAQLSYLIGRKIAEEGIAPRPLFAQAQEEIERTLSARLEKALAGDAEVIADRVITRIVKQ